MLVIVLLCIPALAYGVMHLMSDYGPSAIRETLTFVNIMSFSMLGAAFSPITSLTATWLLRRRWPGLSRAQRVTGLALCIAALLWSAYFWGAISMITMRG